MGWREGKDTRHVSHLGAELAFESRRDFLNIQVLGSLFKSLEHSVDLN